MKVTMAATMSTGVFLFCSIITVGANVPYSMDMEDGNKLFSSGTESSDGPAVLREETTFHLNGHSSDYFKKAGWDGSISSNVPFFYRNRRTQPQPKECNIAVQKVETQKGRCIKLADNTPACHNDKYLSIDFFCSTDTDKID